jgi:hypothetical protein
LSFARFEHGSSHLDPSFGALTFAPVFVGPRTVTVFGRISLKILPIEHYKAPSSIKAREREILELRVRQKVGQIDQIWTFLVRFNCIIF